MVYIDGFGSSITNRKEKYIMGRKVWYEIVLTIKQENWESPHDHLYIETIAKVKTRGLASIVLNEVSEVYKDTIYKVRIL